MPLASEAIAAVIVRLPSNAECVYPALSAAPPAIKTTMVSPMALDVATIKLATMPDIAAGNTTLEEITDFRAPSPACL